MGVCPVHQFAWINHFHMEKMFWACHFVSRCDQLHKFRASPVSCHFVSIRVNGLILDMNSWHFVPPPPPAMEVGKPHVSRLIPCFRVMFLLCSSILSSRVDFSRDHPVTCFAMGAPNGGDGGVATSGNMEMERVKYLFKRGNTLLMPRANLVKLDLKKVVRERIRFTRANTL